MCEAPQGVNQSFLFIYYFSLSVVQVFLFLSDDLHMLGIQYPDIVDLQWLKH